MKEEAGLLGRESVVWSVNTPRWGSVMGKNGEQRQKKKIALGALKITLLLKQEEWRKLGILS